MPKRRMTLGLAFVAGLAISPLSLLVLAVTGLLSFDAISPPPGWEVAIGQRALMAAADERVRHVVNPFQNDSEQSLALGMKLYRNNCAGCHGTATARSSWGDGNFYPRVPQFWQQPLSLTPEQAFVIVRDGVRYSGMGAWRDQLDNLQLWEVANFVSKMHHLPRTIDDRWQNPKSGR